MSWISKHNGQHLKLSLKPMRLVRWPWGDVDKLERQKQSPGAPGHRDRRGEKESSGEFSLEPVR